MSAHHYAIAALIAGAVAGYFYAGKLVAYPPYKQVVGLV